MDNDVEEDDVRGSAPASATSEDPELVDRVVVQVRDILTKTVCLGMDRVGQLLLREFFDDNPALYTSASHTKHASLRLLLDRCGTMDLPVRRTFLANALQMAVFTRSLPTGSVFMRLPPSHRVELLRLREPEQVEAIAANALEKKMTVQSIRSAVRYARENTKSTRGRKPNPEILRTLGACARTLHDEMTGEFCFREDEVGQLSKEQRVRALQLAVALSKRIDDVLKLLSVPSISA